MAQSKKFPYFAHLILAIFVLVMTLLMAKYEEEQFGKDLVSTWAKNLFVVMVFIVVQNYVIPKTSPKNSPKNSSKVEVPPDNPQHDLPEWNKVLAAEFPSK